MKIFKCKLTKNIIMTIQYIALLVDRSGSMKGKEEDTIGGINACIEQLKNEKDTNDEIYITLKWFDHEQIDHCNNISINEFNPLDINEFKPRGQTALLDAMGDTINKYIFMKENNPVAFNSCIIYITTDGLENSSKNYSKNNIKSLIELAKKDHDIMVIYMAANQDAIFEAQSIGINSGHAINYNEDSSSTRAVYSSAAKVAYRSRTGGDSNFLNAERQASQPNSSPPIVNRQNGIPINELTPPNAPRLPRFNNSLGFQQSLYSPPPPPPSPLIPERSSTIPSSPDLWKQHLFLDAAKDSNWIAIKGFLNESPNLINVTGGGANRWTVLHQACSQNNLEMIKYLLNIGADKTIKNRDGLLPIELTSLPEAKQLLEDITIASLAM